MVHKIITMKARRDSDGDITWYEGGEPFEFCSSAFQIYWDVNNDFEIHASDVRPRTDDYYTVVRDSDAENADYGDVEWRFWDLEGEDRHPWDSDLDNWLDNNFPHTDQIYAWTEA